MQDVLFRGLTTWKPKGHGFNHVWVEGDLIVSDGKYYIHPRSNKIRVQGELGKLVVMHEVIPETVGEFVGVTDKNGKRIFEGDLLNGFEYPFLSDNEHNYFAEVVRFDSCPAFGLYTRKYPQSSVKGISEGNCDIIEGFDSSQWEVIGNIYDNAELLK